jgi:predicted amidohydrolase
MGLHVVACQLDIAWEDKAENHRRAAALLEQANPPRGSLVVLPEMFATGFSMNVDATAEGDERERALPRGDGAAARRLRARRRRYARAARRPRGEPGARIRP